jgi:CheY-like chemotaxis protein
MSPKRTPTWERPEEFDHVVLVADDEPLHRQAIVDRLLLCPGRLRATALGRYPRFKVVAAADGDEAIRKVKADVEAAAIDLVMPRRSGIEVIQELRARRSDLAILAFTAGAPPSEAVAAIMAGADHFHEFQDVQGFEYALELALSRRHLTRLIEDNQAQVEEARRRLAKISGTVGAPVPGLRPPLTAEAVIPFREAARRYLAAAARLFEQDPQGLAKRLGISYFALRRLLKRYDVPIPSRSRKDGTRKG